MLVAENDAPDSNPNSRVTHVAKLPAELFLAIMKLLADGKDLKTLLELTLGNRTLAAFGRPILKNYPRRDIWLALQSTDDENQYFPLIVVGAFTGTGEAQRE